MVIITYYWNTDESGDGGTIWAPSLYLLSPACLAPPSYLSPSLTPPVLPTLSFSLGLHAGWIMSISFGAPATFEWKEPTRGPKYPPKVYSVEVHHGDCLFSNGGVLEHRVAKVHSDRVPMEFAAVAGPDVSRLNLQIRKYGVSNDHTYNAIVRPQEHEQLPEDLDLD